MAKKIGPLGKLVYGPLKPRAINSAALKSVKFHSGPKKKKKADKLHLDETILATESIKTAVTRDTLSGKGQRKLFKREDEVARKKALNKSREIIEKHKNLNGIKN